MTESEYESKLKWIEEHMDIKSDDPLFGAFCKIVEEVEEYEESK